MARFTIGLTDHLEGPIDRPSNAVFAEVADLVRLADELGVRHAWFAEHHDHAHLGHLPTPLLFALHLAGQTRRIELGTGITCLNLHHLREVAEQVAVADILTGGRLAVGFGSGSTPQESALFGTEVLDESVCHARFVGSLREILRIWSSESVPRPAVDLPSRCWQAVNSVGSAEIAGKFGFNVLFSHLRTPEQYREYAQAYRRNGGQGRIAANRPVFVGPDDRTAFDLIEPVLRILWRRFQREGKIPGSMVEPDDPSVLCKHPINFIVGGPESVARQFMELLEKVPFDVANVEVRWAGLTHEQVLDSLRRLMKDVMPIVESLSR